MIILGDRYHIWYVVPEGDAEKNLLFQLSAYYKLPIGQVDNSRLYGVKNLWHKCPDSCPHTKKHVLIQLSYPQR